MERRRSYTTLTDVASWSRKTVLVASPLVIRATGVAIHDSSMSLRSASRKARP